MVISDEQLQRVVDDTQLELVNAKQFTKMWFWISRSDKLARELQRAYGLLGEISESVDLMEMRDLAGMRWEK